MPRLPIQHEIKQTLQKHSGESDWVKTWCGLEDTRDFFAWGDPERPCKRCAHLKRLSADITSPEPTEEKTD